MTIAFRTQPGLRRNNCFKNNNLALSGIERR